MAPDLTTTMDALEMRPCLPDRRSSNRGFVNTILCGKLNIGDVTGLTDSANLPNVVIGEAGTMMGLAFSIREDHTRIPPHLRHVLALGAKSQMTRVDAAIGSAAVVAGMKDGKIAGVTVGQYPHAFGGGNSFAAHGDAKVTGRCSGKNDALIRFRYRRVLQEALNLSVWPHISESNVRVAVSGYSRMMHRAIASSELFRLVASFNGARPGGLSHG